MTPTPTTVQHALAGDPITDLLTEIRLLRFEIARMTGQALEAEAAHNATPDWKSLPLASERIQ